MNTNYFVTRERCPACHATQFKELYKSSYAQTPLSDYLHTFYDPQGGVEFGYLENTCYDLNECLQCRLLFQKAIPNDFLMQRLYEKWIDPQKVFQEHLQTYDLTTSSFYAHEISAIIACLRKRPSDLKFFDFGMGWGAWATMVKGFGCDSFGTELSEARIEHARANGITVIHWDEIPQHQFDFINTEQVFEHIPEPLETLRYRKQALTDDGWIKISVPTALNITKRLSRMDWQSAKGTKYSLNPVAPLEHINFYRRESLLKKGQLAGLQEVCIPLHIQYRFATNWSGIKKFIQNLYVPIARNILKRENYLFFSKAAV